MCKLVAWNLSGGRLGRLSLVAQELSAAAAACAGEEGEFAHAITNACEKSQLMWSSVLDEARAFRRRQVCVPVIQ